MFSGNRHMPYGWWNGDKRKVNLNWSDNSFDDNCWFAFVRKSRCSPAVHTSGRCFLLKEMLQCHNGNADGVFCREARVREGDAGEIT